MFKRFEGTRLQRRQGNPWVELLESRRLLSADPAQTGLSDCQVIGSGWVGHANGVTVSFLAPEVRVTGGDGDDVIRMSIDPASPDWLRMELNGAVVTVNMRPSGFTTALRVFGGGGNDYIELDAVGGPFVMGDLYGGDGDDTLVSSCGGNILGGGDGNDVLISRGPVAAILMEGGAGDDQLVCQSGSSRMYGGEGRDTFDGDMLLDNDAGPEDVVFRRLPAPPAPEDPVDPLGPLVPDAGPVPTTEPQTVPETIPGPANSAPDAAGKAAHPTPGAHGSVMWSNPTAPPASVAASGFDDNKDGRRDTGGTASALLDRLAWPG